MVCRKASLPLRGIQLQHQAGQDGGDEHAGAGGRQVVDRELRRFRLGVDGRDRRHALHQVVQRRHVPHRQRQRAAERRAQQRRADLGAGEQVVEESLELRHAPQRAAGDQDHPGHPGMDGLADGVRVFPFAAVGGRRWRCSCRPWPAPRARDLSRKRVFGCHTKRRNRAVQITENTPGHHVGHQVQFGAARGEPLHQRERQRRRTASRARLRMLPSSCRLPS